MKESRNGHGHCVQALSLIGELPVQVQQVTAELPKAKIPAVCLG
jgi:hypothetical protein